MSDTTIELTPVQVRRLEQANAELSRLYSLYAMPLHEIETARQAAFEALSKIVKDAGHDKNGATWDVKEVGDSVQLVMRADA